MHDSDSALKQHAHQPRQAGTLVRLKDEGYGFIRPDDGSPDYYVSISSMRNRADWTEGARVEFTPGKPFAVRPGEKNKATPAWDVVAIRDVRTVNTRDIASRKLAAHASA